MASPKREENPDYFDADHPAMTACLVGHTAAKERLLAACNAGRLPHAWLLAGPKGIGKATLAHSFARFLLSRPDADGGLFAGADAAPPATSLKVDENNPHVRQIRAGGHPGLKTIERTPDPKSGKMRKVIAVDDVRKLNDFYAMTAADGGWRVAIIDSADELNPNSANALLKVLEEPPGKSILLLISSAPGRLLPTIRSRCQQLALGPLSPDETREVLGARYPDLGAGETQKLAALSGGRPGWGSTLASEGGLELYGEVLTLCAQMPDIPAIALHRLAEKMAARGKEKRYELFLDLWLGWVSRLVREAARGARPENIDGREAEIATRLLGLAGLDRWLELWEKMARRVRDTSALNLDKKTLLFELCYLMQRACGGTGTR